MLLLDVVVTDGDDDDDEDGDDDGGTIDPAKLPTVLEDTDADVDDGGDAQDLEDQVGEAFSDHITDGCDLSLEWLVMSVS